MKNYKRFIASVIAAAISTGATTSLAFAKENDAEDTSALSAENTVTTGAETADLYAERTALDSPAYKDETVYVLCGRDSGIKNIIVSDWLRNPPALDKLSDVSELKNIENVKGDETFESDGESLSWNAAGHDIYYKGTVSKELPVGVSMKYYFDGEEVDPQSIKGRSGHLKIRWDYTNNQKVKTTVNGVEREVYVPFACVSAALLDSEKFVNATISSGKIISDGNRLIVVGIAFPGLNESLALDSIESFDAEVPEYVELEADVLGFEMNTSVTAVTNELFSKLDFDADFNFGELKTQIDKLIDASNQLCEGTASLYGGIAELSSKTDDVSDGIGKLSSGALELSGGASKLSEGANALSTGAKTLSDSTSTLKNGVKSAKDGSGQLVSGIDKLSSGTSSLKTGIDSAKTGSAELSAGLSKADKGADSLVSGASELSTGAASVSSGAKELAAGLSSAGSSLSTTIAANEQALAALQSAYKSAPSKELGTAIETLKTTIESQKQIAAAMSSGGALSNGAAAVQQGSEKLSSGSKTLSSGISSLDASLGKLAAGAASLDSGMGKLSTGAVDLNKGFSSLKTGAGSLDSGLGELLTGSTKLESGALKLYQSTGELAAGAGTLAEGSKSLWSGADELKKGFVAYSEGIKKLESGSKELSEGADKFNKEGITKLSAAIDEKLPAILENFKAVREVSKAYKNYSGISSSMDGSVKFIYTFDGTD